MDEDLGLMDYKFRFYSPTLGRFILPDNIVPDATNPQDWNRYTYARNNPILYNDPSGHCINTSNGWDKINCIGSIVFSTLSYIKENPNSVIINGKSFNIPVVLPKGFGRQNIEIVNTTISFKTIRIVGRLGDDTIPATFIAGGLLTLAPEQIENIHKGAPISEYVADALIDGGGYVVSEIVGDAFGAASAPIVGPWAIGVMVLSDAWAGNIYDNYFTDERRSFLQEILEATQITPPKTPGIVPTQVPHPPLIPNGTPTPQGFYRNIKNIMI